MTQPVSGCIRLTLHSQLDIQARNPCFAPLPKEETTAMTPHPPDKGGWGGYKPKICLRSAWNGDPAHPCPENQ